MENRTVHGYLNKKGKIRIHLDGHLYKKYRLKRGKCYCVCIYRRTRHVKCKSGIILRLTDNCRAEIVSKQIKAHNHKPLSLETRRKVSFVFTHPHTTHTSIDTDMLECFK